MTDYHGRIAAQMPVDYEGRPEFYRTGHWDARKASAEIAVEADAEIARLTSERDALRAALREMNDLMRTFAKVKLIQWSRVEDHADDCGCALCNLRRSSEKAHRLLSGTEESR